MKDSTQIPEMVADRVTRRRLLSFIPALAGLPLVRQLINWHSPRNLPACVVVPQQTEGPFFANVKLERSDIRTDPSDGTVCVGVPLRLGIHVSRVSDNSCTALADAVVDIWQCDAHGRYSAFRNSGGGEDMRKKQFLRGHQVTDQGGTARFVTIFPGWYRGRAVHIHFKIRTDPDQDRGYEFTSQLYFDEALTQAVGEREEYADNSVRRVTNARDRIFRRGGDLLTLALEENEEGFVADFAIGLEF